MVEGLGAFVGTARYTPVRQLGAGGMGAVYEVIDRSSGQRLALKVMLEKTAANLLRFKNEFRVVAELHHPNLVRLFDLEQDGGTWFFTMELVEGTHLVETFHRTPDEEIVTVLDSPLATAQNIPSADATTGPVCDLDVLRQDIAQVIDGLEHLHRHGLVHRDLKPSNILVDLDGRVRLLDFGLTIPDTTPESGRLEGTIEYMSPEQGLGAAVTAAADRYALGTIMFRLLTGKLPFEGSPSRIVEARLMRTAPRIDQRVTGVPAGIVDIIHRLLDREPDARPSLDEVRAALGLSIARRATPTGGTGGLVGRSSELAGLRACLDRAAEGRAQLALVAGESGMGKSTLAAQIEKEAAERGFLCIGGRCYERERLPFVALDRAIDRLVVALAAWPAERLAPMLGAVETLRPVFPSLGILLQRKEGRDEAPDSANPRELRERAFAGLRRLIEGCQAEAPLLIVLDDLQWADDESIALLEAVLSMADARVFVLGLTRPDGLERERPVSRLFAREGAHVVELRGLSPADVAEIALAVPGELDAESARRIAGIARGNPFLAWRLASHAANVSKERRAEVLSTPERADEWLRDVLGGLTEDAASLLSLASVAGGDTDPAVLRDASGLSASACELALAELSSARLLRAVPSPLRGPRSAARSGATQGLDVYHDIVREVAYEGLTLDRRRSLHRALAEALEGRADAGTLLRHWSEVGDRAKKRRYAVLAAEQAAEKLAFAHAVDVYRMALDDPDPDESPAARAARWERVGELCEYAGRLGEAGTAYAASLVLWEGLPESEQRSVALLRVRGRAAETLLATGKLDEGGAMLERAYRVLGRSMRGPVPVHIASVLALEAACEAAPFVSRFTSHAAPTELQREEIRFYDRVVRITMPVWPLVAAEAQVRCELLGRRFGDLRSFYRSATARAALVVFRRGVSDRAIERAHRVLAELTAVTERHGIRAGAAIIRAHRAVLLLATDHELARREIEAALEDLSRVGMRDFYESAVARMYWILILLWKGDDDDALRAIEREATSPEPNFNNSVLLRVYQCRILAIRGEVEEARAILARLDVSLAGAPHTFLAHRVALTRCELDVARGDYRAALRGCLALTSSARSIGIFLVGIHRTAWLETALEAAVGLLQRRELTRAEAARARRWARELTRNGVLDAPCLGWRALALFDADAGELRSARRAIEEALRRSRTSTTPYRRWLCLGTAIQLGVRHGDLEGEAATLAERHRFAHAGV